MIPCSYWASACEAVLPSYETLYVISVRQTRDLPVVSLFPHPASFRFHLVMDTLAFGYILPTTGRIRDLHPLETCAARRTKKEPAPILWSLLLNPEISCLCCRFGHRNFLTTTEYFSAHAALRACRMPGFCGSGGLFFYFYHRMLALSRNRLLCL